MNQDRIAQICRTTLVVLWSLLRLCAVGTLYLLGFLGLALLWLVALPFTGTSAPYPVRSSR